jgi:hypothetical protein
MHAHAVAWSPCNAAEMPTPNAPAMVHIRSSSMSHFMLVREEPAPQEQAKDQHQIGDGNP